MERAITFYETVLGLELSRHKMGELDMTWFPMANNAPGPPGSLVYHVEFYKPSSDGPLLYFTAHSGNLSNELSRVEASGGTIEVTKTQITPDIGYMAVLRDTEGNRIALHSIK